MMSRRSFVAPQLAQRSDFTAGIPRVAERIRDAKCHQRRSGQYLGGDRPFGWRIGEDGALIEDEAEQNALAEMRDLRAAGDSYRSIAAHMKSKGIEISHQGVKRALARSA